MNSPLSCRFLRPTANYGTEERECALTLLRPADNGINQPWYACAKGVGYGYFKCCAATDPDMEELEVWMAFLGSRLGVSMADTWLVLDQSGKKLGCFSLDVTPPNGTYTTAQQNKEQWLMHLDSPPVWAQTAAQLYQAAPTAEPLPDHRLSIVEDEAVLFPLLQFVYGVLSCDGQYDVAAGFTDMILLDSLVWQKDRNMHGFGLVQHAEGTPVMAPLYDNASISLPGLPEGKVGFCNILCAPQLLIQCTARLFPQHSHTFFLRLEHFLRQEKASFLQMQEYFLSKPYSSRMVQRIALWDALAVDSGPCVRNKITKKREETQT